MRLSVVVTIVDGGRALERCLDALASQHDPSGLEVLVPWDDTVPDAGLLASRFPAFRFLPLGTLPAEGPPHARTHALYDRRRSAGLAAATGDLIGVLEDRGVPRPNWARAMIGLHERLPHAAIGGAIENGLDSILNWAVYYCDFGRYQLPFEDGPRRWVSDVNVSYKRYALEKTRALWQDRYHETTVHWALQRAGETLYLATEPVVDQVRGRLALGALIEERFVWGRLFAYTRSVEVTASKRILLAALSPLLPLALFARHLRRQVRRPAGTSRLINTSPAMFLLLIAWSAGEAVGYLTAKP